MNPLPIIALWLETFPYHDCSDMSRADLIEWITKLKLNGGEASIQEVYAIEDVELAADCLIAAGIGCSYEQKQSVLCTVDYL